MGKWGCQTSTQLRRFEFPVRSVSRSRRKASETDPLRIIIPDGSAKSTYGRGTTARSFVRVGDLDIWIVMIFGRVLRWSKNMARRPWYWYIMVITKLIARSVVT